MNFLPVGINISGKKILIIGGGNVAFQKAKILSQYTKDIDFLAKEFKEELVREFGDHKFIKKSYKKNYLKGYFLVYACSNDENLNRIISKDAKSLKILVNVCDKPDLSDFISPAIYKKENLSIAVTSNAKDVRKSIDLRNKIKEFLEDAWL